VGEWPCQSIRFTLEGGPSKLRLGGVVQMSQTPGSREDLAPPMPWGLKRFQQSRQLHVLTFSCFHRLPNFATPTSRTTFESSLERVRQDYGLRVYGYVVMPEHVHLLVSEPERDTLARALQSLKQSVARRLALRAADPFWQARYYDFNVWSEMKFVEKL
jgi:putative transposase